MRSYAEEVVALATAHGFPVWRGMGQLLLGWALAYSDDGARGIALIREALTQLATVGTQVNATGGLFWLADAERAAGREAQALAAIETGLAIADARDDHVYESELHRLKGDILLRRSVEDAERAFRRALEAAGAQHAPMLELRAATGLACLLRETGRRAEARGVLAEILGRMQEGLDTPDVRDAAELIAEPARA